MGNFNNILYVVFVNFLHIHIHVPWPIQRSSRWAISILWCLRTRRSLKTKTSCCWSRTRFFFFFTLIFLFFFTIFLLSFFNRLRTRWRASRLSSSRHQDSRSPSRLRRWTQRLCFPFLLFHRIVFVVNLTLWSASSNFQWNCYRLLLTPTPWGTIICYLKYMLYYIVWYNSTKGWIHPLLGGLRPKQCKPSKQALSRQVWPLNII